MIWPIKNCTDNIFINRTHRGHVAAKQVVLEVNWTYRLTDLKWDAYYLESHIAPRIMMNGWTTYVLADLGSDLVDFDFACLENWEREIRHYIMTNRYYFNFSFCLSRHRFLWCHWDLRASLFYRFHLKRKMNIRRKQRSFSEF